MGTGRARALIVRMNAMLKPSVALFSLPCFCPPPPYLPSSPIPLQEAMHDDLADLELYSFPGFRVRTGPKLTYR